VAGFYLPCSSLKTSYAVRIHDRSVLDYGGVRYPVVGGGMCTCRLFVGHLFIVWTVGYIVNVGFLVEWEEQCDNVGKNWRLWSSGKANIEY
jgi:hypothetical protein